MRIYFCEENETNPMHVHWILKRPMTAGLSALDKYQIQGKCHISQTKVNENLLTLFIHDRNTTNIC